MRLLKFLHPACRRRPFTVNSLYPNFIVRGPVTPVGPVTVTDALLLLLLVFCDICSSSLSLSFESLDSIISSNFHYYFQDGRSTRYYNRRTGHDHRHHIYRPQRQGPDPQGQGSDPKDQDKDLKYVLKESLRTRINITAGY